MNDNEIDRSIKPRTPEPDDRKNGIIPAPRRGKNLFAGWGPRLLSVTLAACTLGLSVSASPASADTPAQAACSVRQHDAQILSNPVPDMPEVAVLEYASGTAVLRVDLSADGQLENASIATSTGNDALDREALRVARESRYAPAVSDCQNIASSYLYTVNFDR
jgi:TonB family protein